MSALFIFQDDSFRKTKGEKKISALDSASHPPIRGRCNSESAFHKIIIYNHNHNNNSNTLINTTWSLSEKNRSLCIPPAKNFMHQQQGRKQVIFKVYQSSRILIKCSKTLNFCTFLFFFLLKDINFFFLV